MAEFGIPYMGSKSSIVRKIIDIFPSADNFYDLFGGGFSVTHGMLLYRKDSFKNFHFNEIRNGVCELIKDAIAGKYNYKVFKPKWIDRETFFREKENNAYIKICWSFGNNGKGYLFGTDIEEYKKSLHNAVVFDVYDNHFLKLFRGEEIPGKIKDITERRSWVKRKIKIIFNKLPESELKQLQQLQQLERLEQLQQLEQLERLEQLEQLERLHFTSVDYREVNIKENSVIYCDIPYEGAADYGKEFKHNEFYEWVLKQSNPVFVSEYARLEKRGLFLCRSIEKLSLLAGDGKERKVKNELIFCNEIAKKIIEKKYEYMFRNNYL